jgi:hypothetical protein
MKYLNTNILNSTLVLFVFATFGLIACKSNDDLADHADAVGYVLELNNAEILRFENNQYEWNPEGTRDDYYQELNGETYFTLSPEVIDDMSGGMTPTITVRWLDGDGEKFDLPEEDEGGEYWLDWDWQKPNTLTDECSQEAREDTEDLEAIRPANLEQHGSDRSWGFHFRADHVGQDQIRFKLMHLFGEAAHADLVSGWFTVVVADAEHDQIDENGIYMHERNRCRER